MSEAVEKLVRDGYNQGRNKGFDEGQAEGRAEGRNAARIESARKLIRMNKLSNEEIADSCNLTVDEVRKTRDDLMVTA